MNGQLLQTCRQLIAYPAILHDLLEDTGTRNDQKDHRDIFHGLPIDCHNRLDTTSLPDAQRISRMNLGQVLELHLGWIAHAGWDISLDPDAEAAWKKYQGEERPA